MKKWVEFGKHATYLYFANVNGFDSWSFRKVRGTNRVVESWDLRADDWVTLHSTLLFCMTLPSLSAPSPGLTRVSSNLGTYLFEKCTINHMCYKQGVWLQVGSSPGFTSRARWDQDICICFHKFLLWFGALRGQRGCQSKLKQAASETLYSVWYHPAAILHPSVGTLPVAPGPRKMKGTISPLNLQPFLLTQPKALTGRCSPWYWSLNKSFWAAFWQNQETRFFSNVHTHLEDWEQRFRGMIKCCSVNQKHHE